MKESFAGMGSNKVTIEQVFLGSLLHMKGYSCLYIHNTVKATSFLIDVIFIDIIFGPQSIVLVNTLLVD